MLISNSNRNSLIYIAANYFLNQTNIFTYEINKINEQVNILIFHKNKPTISNKSQLTNTYEKLFHKKNQLDK